MVRAELCSAPTRSVAVVVLHGCGGFSTFDHRIVATLPLYRALQRARVPAALYV